MPRPKPLNALIERIGENTLDAQIDDGRRLTLVPPADAIVTRSRAGMLSDVKPGRFIGCTAVENADSTLVAQEIHVIPDVMRGVGEGHYPWGDAPNTTMTNGNIEQLTGITDGQVIKVSYKGGESTIKIPPDVKVTITEQVGRATLRPGTEVKLLALEDARGVWTVRHIRLAQ
jgi:hypothetical protein